MDRIMTRITACGTASGDTLKQQCVQLTNGGWHAAATGGGWHDVMQPGSSAPATAHQTS